MMSFRFCKTPKFGDDVPGSGVGAKNFDQGVAMFRSVPVRLYLSASSLVVIWCMYTASPFDKPPLFSSMERPSPKARWVVGRSLDISMLVGLFGSVLMSSIFLHDAVINTPISNEYFSLRSIIQN